MNEYLKQYFRYAIIRANINNNANELLLIMEDWIKYNNPNLKAGIEIIFENSDYLPENFFDRLIEILDENGKTEYALQCVMEMITKIKKERFEL